MRRYALVLLAAALGVGLLVPLPAVGKAAKVAVCHYEELKDSWKLIEVSEKAASKHAEHHMDGVPGDELFDEECVLRPVERIFAVAYTDVDPSDGGYNPGVDVLIAKLVDGPGVAGDGVAGPGDLVITDSYPRNTDPVSASDFGQFGVTEHVVTAVTLFSATNVEARGTPSASVAFRWTSVATDESYSEQEASGSIEDFSEIRDDRHEVDSSDRIQLGSISPSRPETLVTSTFREGNGDDPFIDVEIFS